MNFNWAKEGFSAPPVLSPATGKEKLFRAWGGDPKRKWGNTTHAGVCFSLDRAKSRLDAERLYAVMEYSNSVIWITEFSVGQGAPLWIGMVDPGDRRAQLGGYSGNQVYIERPSLGLVREARTDPLRNDLGGAYVHPQPLPSGDRKKPQN
jgi:hypothetical protein